MSKDMGSTKAQAAAFWHDPRVIDLYLQLSRSNKVDWYEHEVNWPSVKQLLPTNATRVLDFGCAGGEYTDAIAQATGATVDACDISEAMLARLQVTGKYTTFIWDGMHAQPKLAKTYDVVVAKMVLMFIDDLQTVAKNIHDVLTDSGVLVVSVHHPQKTVRHAVRAGSDYFTDTAYQNEFDDGDLTGTFYHRPVMGWIEPFLRHGFVVTKIVEPQVSPAILQQHHGDPVRWAIPKRLNFQLQKKN